MQGGARYLVGLDLGLAGDYTALAVLERTEAPDPERPGRNAGHYPVRHLERFPVGAAYAEVCARLGGLFGRPPLEGGTLAVDQTAVGRLVPGAGQYGAFPTGLSAEQYYALLSQPSQGQQGRQEAPESGAGGGGQGNAPSDPGGGAVTEPGEKSQAALRQSQAEWEVAVAQAQQVARARGELPAGLARLVEQVLQPKVDWKEVLREFLSRHARNDYSWSPPPTEGSSTGGCTCRGCAARSWATWWWPWTRRARSAGRSWPASPPRSRASWRRSTPP